MTIVVPPPIICSFTFDQLLIVSGGLNILIEKFRNKQFITFKLYTILSSVISCGIPLRPVWDMNHPFLHTTRCGIIMLTFKLPMFYLILAPTCRNSDAERNTVLCKQGFRTIHDFRLLLEVSEYISSR